LLLHPLPAGSGNLELVEKDVQELDSLNREALRQVGGLPRDGSVDLKAYVTVEGGKSKVTLQEKKITIEGSSSGSPKGKSLTEAAPFTDPTEGKIEYLEKNDTPTKASPGGKNVR